MIKILTQPTVYSPQSTTGGHWLVMCDITLWYYHDTTRLLSLLRSLSLNIKFIQLTLALVCWAWPGLGWAGRRAAILSICCPTKPRCSVMRRTTWWRKWKMIINMRDSYGQIKIDRGQLCNCYCHPVRERRGDLVRRSFPLQVYKLNWNIPLSVSCSFVKVDGHVHECLYI